MKSWVRLAGAVGLFLACGQQAHADEGHLFIVYNHESGHILVRLNPSDDEMAKISPDTKSIRATGWDVIEADSSHGWGAISCVRRPGTVWFDYSTGHPSDKQAIMLATAGAEKHAREYGGMVIPNCGPVWNNQGQSQSINWKAPEQ